MAMKERIRKLLLDLGADDCGFGHIDAFSDAPKGFHPTDVYPDCRSVVVFIKRLSNGLKKVSPRIVYHHANMKINDEIDSIARKASVAIEDLGGVAVPMPCDDPYEYWDAENKEGRALLSMRHAAMLAGLGSLGKNTLFIHKAFGNMVNIGMILTNLELESDPPSREMCLPGCRLCLDKCPSHALDGVTVIQKRCREHTYSFNEKGYAVCNCNTCRVICPAGR